MVMSEPLLKARGDNHREGDTRGADEPPRPKRRRIPEACQRCRLKKSRVSRSHVHAVPYIDAVWQ